MAKPRNFLFVCKGNEARSQMAVGFAQDMASGNAHVWSAGASVKGLNPHAVDVMGEVGIDITSSHPKSSKEVPFKKIDTIVTLSSDADTLPKITAKKVTQIHWPLDDPTSASGTEAEIKMAYREVRDEIRNRIEVLLVG